MMRFALLLSTVLFTIPITKAQMNTDEWLSALLREKASPALLHILNNPDSFSYQLIYTQIDRDENNLPSFKHHHLQVNKNRYFNPASTVKMPLAFLALEKLNKLHIPGVNKFTPMLTDSAASYQTAVTHDSSSQNGLPSIAHYIKKNF